MNVMLSRKKLSGKIPFSYAFRLAWRQLWHEKVRFVTAVAGVVFACILVFMQIGFKISLFDSATLLQRTIRGDIFLQEAQSEALWRLVTFPRQHLYRALSIPEVDNVTALYVSQAPWKNPLTGQNRSTLILGLSPEADIYPFVGFDKFRDQLQMRDTVLFDEFSRPEYGPVKKMLAEKGEFSVEVGGHQLDVIGTFQMGITFSADGNVIVNDTTFFRLFPGRSQDGVDIGIITLKQGASVDTAKAKLRALLPMNIQVMSKEEYIASEEAYWADLMPIGYIFNFGVVMGLIVGLVIVYQVLFNDITNHLSEYATLKAMGYDNSYFTRVVLSAAIILALCGFIPGIGFCYILYDIVHREIFIDIVIPFDKLVSVFFLIFGMCFLSAFLAIRRLKAANPADVFQ